MKYEGTISFETNKELTQKQLDQLSDLLHLQVIEPQDENQEDEDYKTFNSIVTFNKKGN
jgi:hypothetical protein